MRYIFLIVFFSGLGFFSFGQTYISFAPSISNQAGTFADKINLNVEVGR